jgi:hypothetical protein
LNATCLRAGRLDVVGVRPDDLTGNLKAKGLSLEEVMKVASRGLVFQVFTVRILGVIDWSLGETRFWSVSQSKDFRRRSYNENMKPTLRG